MAAQNRESRDASVTHGETPIAVRLMRIESEFRKATRDLPRQEREKFDSFLWNSLRFDFGPKVTISQMVGTGQKASLGMEHEGAIKSAVDYYQKKVDHRELLRVLRYYAAFFLQQARKETTFSKQAFLLFKAVDMLRMVTQYAGYSINVDAETIVFGIFADLGEQRPDQFAPYFDAQIEIVKAMRRLQAFPGDHRVREKLAELYYKQTSYFDSVMQFEFLSRTYPKMPITADLRRGETYLRIAKIIQELAHVPTNRLGDARKLRNFIDRYNRDFVSKGKGIIPMSGNNPDLLQKSMNSMLPAANVWYRKALEVTRMRAPLLVEAVMNLSQNLAQTGNFKESLAVLVENQEALKKVGTSPSAWETRLEYINQLIALATKLKKRDVTAKALEQQRDFRGEVEKIQQRQKDIEGEAEQRRMRKEQRDKFFEENTGDETI